MYSAPKTPPFDGSWFAPAAGRAPFARSGSCAAVAARAVALQRGPLVYCVEGSDNDGSAWNVILPENTKFTEQAGDVLGERITALDAQLPVVVVNADGSDVSTRTKKVRAIPYYTWCNRGSNAMQVWLPVKIKDIKINY